MISRFESEKAGLQDTDFIVFADFMGELASMCNREYGDIFNRGELESSFVAWLLGATKCNPLPAHYYCPRVCLKNSLIRNFGGFCAISASSTLDLALLSHRVSSLN